MNSTIIWKQVIKAIKSQQLLLGFFSRVVQRFMRVNVSPGAHCVSKLEVFLIEQAAWILSNSKVTRKPPLLDELTSFGQRESAPAILGLY